MPSFARKYVRTIYGKELFRHYSIKISVTKIFQKVFLVFNFGHLFLSIFENLKYFSKKAFLIDVSYHNALKIICNV